MARGARGQGSGSQKKREKEIPGDRGRPRGAHHGEEGGRRCTAATVRAREKTADGVGAAPPCGNYELRGVGENGVERGSRGRLGCGLRFKEARRGEGRSHDARRSGAGGGCSRRTRGRLRDARREVGGGADKRGRDCSGCGAGS